MINADRLARKMSWPDYAAWHGLVHSTIYKIAKGTTTRPHELTVHTILENIRKHPIRKKKGDDYGASLVSDRHGHAERPEGEGVDNRGAEESGE